MGAASEAEDGATGELRDIRLRRATLWARYFKHVVPQADIIVIDRDVKINPPRRESPGTE